MSQTGDSDWKQIEYKKPPSGIKNKNDQIILFIGYHWKSINHETERSAYLKTYYYRIWINCIEIKQQNYLSYQPNVHVLLEYM